MPAGIFQHHRLVDHGEFEMGGRVVDRDARVLGDRHDDQRDQREPERDAQAHLRRQHERAIVDSWVEPATSARTKMIMIMAGSASEAIMTSRLEPMPPKLVPISMPASARKKRALAEQGDDGDQVGGPAEHQIDGEGRNQRGRDPGGGEDEVGRGAEQPGGVVGEHHLLAQQPQQIAIGLEQEAPWRRSSRALTLRTKPVSSGASSRTSAIWAPWTSRSRIMSIARATSQQRNKGEKTRLR
jgi:hypothetical protein